MRDPHPTPLARSWTVAALTLLALLALAPSQARAVCGRHGVSVFQRSAHFDSLTEAGALADQPDSPAPAPRRCSGALCSGNPAPPLVPTMIEPRTVDSWACLADEPAPATVDSRPRMVGEFVGLPSTAPLSIFHPPRRSLSTPA